MHGSYRHADIEQFCKRHISDIYTIIRETGNLPRLNNQGRRPEQVLYSWLRGYAMTRFLQPAIAELFELLKTPFKTLVTMIFGQLKPSDEHPKPI